MKRIFVFTLLTFLVVMGAIYLLIPDKMTLAAHRIIAANSNAAYRNLIAPPADWSHWLGNDTATTAAYGDYSFVTSSMFTNYNEVVIEKNGDDTLHSQLRFFPVAKDSFLLDWQTTIQTGYNPFKKLHRYFFAKEVKTAMNGVINQFQQFMQRTEKVYGAPISKITVTDTLLIATYAETDSIPGNEKIYSLFNELHKTIRSQNTSIQDSGMLHISKLPSGSYKTMVAIPITREIQPAPQQVIKRMVPGNILLMEKTGGPAAISTAEKMLAQYVTDYTLVSPAIPFQKLMTHRLAEPDSSKWVTRFYYPVF
jgi:hypothetical protein